MLKRGRRRFFLTAGLAAVLVLVFAAGAFGAQSVSRRSLSAIFRNIRININGNFLETEEQPFIVGGSTYVPLRVVSEALGTLVNWDSENNVVSITGDAAGNSQTFQQQLQEKDAEIAELKAEIQALKGDQVDDDTPADTVKTLSGLTKNLVSDYDELQDVKIKDIRLTGNEDEITVNIDVDLEDYDDEWEGLTDSKIKSWISDLCLDVQEYYSDDTVVGGKIKDIDSKDTLVEFSKYMAQPLKVTYKDKDYRDGKGMDVYEVADEWENQKYNVAGLRFNLESVNYKTEKDEIDVSLKAVEARAADWKAADSDAAETAIRDLCKNIAGSFIEDAAENPETINVKVYDKTMASLDSFEYDVSDNILR